MVRITSVMAMATMLLLTATGCGGEETPDVLPLQSSDVSGSGSTNSPSASPSVDRDSWRAKFSDDELLEFDTALRTWEQFGQLMEPYYRQPGNLQEVRAIFEEYTYNPTRYVDSYVLSYLEGGVRVITPPTPLYWTGRTIEVNKKGGLVEFDQCTDYSEADIRRAGKPIPPGPKGETATLRIRMAYDPGDDQSVAAWRVLSTKVVDKPCV